MITDEIKITHPCYDNSRRPPGNTRMEASSNKRKERTNLNRQIARKKDRDEIKALQKRYIELVTGMHENDVNHKEWTIWNNFETQFQSQEIIKLTNIVELLRREIVRMSEKISYLME